MNIEIRYGTTHIDWQAVCGIFEQVPLRNKEPDKLCRAAEHSYVVCTAYSDETLIGFGRALSDGEYQSAIYDVVVLPDYQGRGAGRMIMEALLKRLPDGPVLMYVVPGRETFYRKLGFDDLKTGMAKFYDKERARQKGYID